MMDNELVVASNSVVADYSRFVELDENGEAFFLIPDRSPEAINKQIDDLTAMMFALPDDFRQTDFTDDTEHTLIKGVYTRKLFIRKGTIVVGKFHRKECVNIVAMGDVTILTETGCKRLSAGFIGVSQPGSRKVAIAHEDTIFVNIFRTDKINIDKIEAEIFHCHEPKREVVCLEP